MWLDSRNLNLGYNKKIKARREGPFVIAEVMGPTTYRLTLPDHWKRVRLHNVFQANLLMPYIENETHGPNLTWPPPEIEDTYEVERILRHQKMRDGKYQFQILWKGYGVEDATWHLESDLTEAKKMVEQYKNTHIQKSKRKV